MPHWPHAVPCLRKPDMAKRVAVLGASSDPTRYSYRAVKTLAEKGHIPVPVTLKEEEILGFPAVRDVSDVEGSIDTVTVYVNPTVLASLADSVIAASPRRIIMNPGTEDAQLKSNFEQAGIEVMEACTLVLLSTGQF